MLDVALEDLYYANYPIAFNPAACFAPAIYSKSVSVKEQEEQGQALVPRIGLGMAPALPPPSGESGGNPANRVNPSWSAVPPPSLPSPAIPPQQVPWNEGGDSVRQQIPTLPHQTEQVPNQPLLQQPPESSTLYGTFSETRPALQSLIPSRNQEIQQHDRVHHSFGPGPSSFTVPSTFQTPSTLTSPQSSDHSCLCSLLGQPCTCARSLNRPRFHRGYDQSFTSSSSSSTGGMADTNSSHSSLIMSPVHLYDPLHSLKGSNPQLALEQTPMTTGSGWMTSARGVPVHAEDGNIVPSPYSHPINTQLSSQMSSLYHSPRDSPSTSHLHPSMSYPYQALGPAPQYGTLGDTSSSNDLRLSLAGQSTDSNDASTSRSGYQSADSGLPRWPSRPSSAASSMRNSASLRMPSMLSRASFDPYSLSRPPSSSSSSSGLTTYDGYDRQARTLYLSSASTSSSPSKHATPLQQHDGIDGSSASPSNRFVTEEDRWNAILNRSHVADAFFLYGALTTRVYCRPSCASKRPDRNRVVYFSFPDAPFKAEQEGFRPCKRCKPRTPGTADACVLAVGQCLRHITQAALLGESEEIEPRLKRKTLKEYSSDYGVSAFHFHRTLKGVSTLTPGEYSKACHSLVLQDQIGMDHKNGQQLSAFEVQQRLRGWSSRRARRAVGNILPTTYAQGFPGIKMYYIYAPSTRFGNVCVLYSRGEKTIFDDDQIVPLLDADGYATSGSDNQCTVMGALICDDALARVKQRAPLSVAVPEQSEWLQSLVEDLDKKGLREVQMPVEVIPWVRRARVWLAVKSVLEETTISRGAGKRTKSSEGDDEDDYDGEGGFEEGISNANFAASGSR